MQISETVTYVREGNATECSVTTAPAPSLSVEIATDSKGQVKPTVKIYHEDPQAAAIEAVRLYKQVLEALA
jgi:hypothetical protein